MKDGDFLIQGGHMEECENANMDRQGGDAGTLKKVQRRANHLGIKKRKNTKERDEELLGF